MERRTDVRALEVGELSGDSPQGEDIVNHSGHVLAIMEILGIEEVQLCQSQFPVKQGCVRDSPGRSKTTRKITCSSGDIG